MNAAVHAGIYCRLSVEDETSQESESIQTQKVMLTDFCKNNGYHILQLSSLFEMAIIIEGQAKARPSTYTTL